MPRRTQQLPRAARCLRLGGLAGLLAAALTAAAFFLPLQAAGDAEPQAASAPAKTFTVASYNINYGNPNLKAVVEAIALSKADLVCLQETTPASERYLRAALGRTYRYMDFRHAGGAGGLGFLSSSAFRHVKYIPRKHGWFGSWVVKVKLGGSEVQLAAVHLMPTDLRRAEGFRQAARIFLEREAARLSEIRHIHANLERQVPTILLGDFNTVSGFATVQFLAGQGFADSFASVTEQPDAHPTWHWRHGQTEWKYRLDYIFHTGDLATTASKVVPSEGSDHYLLVSRLAWAPQKSKAQAASQAASPPGAADRAETGAKAAVGPR